MGQYTDKIQMLRKEAGIPAIIGGSAALHYIGDKVKDAYNVVKNDVVGLHRFLGDRALITLPLLAVAGAYGVHKLTEPTAITNNSDDILYLNTLKTETAAARRKLKALEAEERMQEGSSRKVFDKFLG